MIHVLSMNSKVGLQSSNGSHMISIQRLEIPDCGNCMLFLPLGIRVRRCYGWDWSGPTRKVK